MDESKVAALFEREREQLKDRCICIRSGYLLKGKHQNVRMIMMSDIAVIMISMSS